MQWKHFDHFKIQDYQIYCFRYPIPSRLHHLHPVCLLSIPPYWQVVLPSTYLIWLTASLTNFPGSQESMGYRTNTSLKQIKTFPIHSLSAFLDQEWFLFFMPLIPAHRNFPISSPLDSCSIHPLSYSCFFLYQIPPHIPLSRSQGLTLKCPLMVSKTLSFHFPDFVSSVPSPY